MTTHSSILAWRIPWTEATVHGIAESDTTERLTLSLHGQYSVFGKMQYLEYSDKYPEYFFLISVQKEAPFGFGLENTGSEYAVRSPYKDQGFRGGYSGQGGASWKTDATSQGLSQVVVVGRWLRKGIVLQKTSVMFVPCDGKAWPLGRQWQP